MVNNNIIEVDTVKVNSIVADYKRRNNIIVSFVSTESIPKFIIINDVVYIAITRRGDCMVYISSKLSFSRFIVEYPKTSSEYVFSYVEF